MDLSDFTSAENKKMTTENDIPTFNPLFLPLCDYGIV